MGKRIGWTMLAVQMAVGSVSAEIIHVPNEAPTIQIAVQTAQPFDTIIVAPGTYHEAVFFAGKVIAIQSSDPTDPAVVEQTVIDAGGLGTVVTFSGAEGNAHVGLNGFTLTGGELGINGNGTLASVENCVVRNNSSIGIYNVQGRIDGCTVTDNAAEGIFESDGPISHCVVTRNAHGLRECNGVISDCELSDNRDVTSQQSNGNGLVHCSGEVVRCTISNNTGSGLSYCDATIRQSFISGNRLDGLQSCKGPYIENSVIAGNRENGFRECSLDVRHCTVTGNQRYGFDGHRTGSIEHCVIWANAMGSLHASTTPIFSGTVNPFFLQPGYWDSVDNVWVEGDYRVAPDSPYIDAGDPFFGDGPADATVDLYGNPRVAGSRIDIGAYEFQEVCEGNDFDGDGHPDNCDRDIDNDGVTNTFDACDFTPPGQPVSADGRPIGDLNLDCVVDLRDFARWQMAINGPFGSTTLPQP